MHSPEPASDNSAHLPHSLHLNHLNALVPHLECPAGCGPFVLCLREDTTAPLPLKATAALKCQRHIYSVYGVIIDFLNPVHADGSSSEHSGIGEITKDVKRYYDDYGWKENAQKIYNDTAIFSRSERSGHDLYATLSRKRLAKQFGSGDLFLDAASGAIAHPEYLTYSRNFKFHVCVDISFSALEAAQSKLGSRGFYMMSDLAHLPFRSGTFDGIFSGYTIQHVAADNQAPAVRELQRVLSPNGVALIVNGIESSSTRTKIINMLSSRANGEATTAQLEPQPTLYCVPRPREWWEKLARDMGTETGAATIESFRLFAKHEFVGLFRDSPRWARVIDIIDALCGRILKGASAYLLLRLKKKS